MSEVRFSTVEHEPQPSPDFVESDLEFKQFMDPGKEVPGVDVYSVEGWYGPDTDIARFTRSIPHDRDPGLNQQFSSLHITWYLQADSLAGLAESSWGEALAHTGITAQRSTRQTNTAELQEITVEHSHLDGANRIKADLDALDDPDTPGLTFEAHDGTYTSKEFIDNLADGKVLMSVTGAEGSHDSIVHRFAWDLTAKNVQTYLRNYAAALSHARKQAEPLDMRLESHRAIKQAYGNFMEMIDTVISIVPATGIVHAALDRADQQAAVPDDQAFRVNRDEVFLPPEEHLRHKYRQLMGSPAFGVPEFDADQAAEATIMRAVALRAAA